MNLENDQKGLSMKSNLTPSTNPLRFMILFIAVLAWVGLCDRRAFAAPRKPNIIYIMADDLGYAELGCFGHKIIHTLNIDRMASEGMRFTQHYSGSPVCAPSRCVLMTGKHTGHSYIRGNGNPKGRSLDPSKSIFPGQNSIFDE